MLNGNVGEENANKLKDLWQRKHRHQFEGPRKVEGTLSRAIKDLIVSKLESKVTTKKPMAAKLRAELLPKNGQFSALEGATSKVELQFY